MKIKPKISTSLEYVFIILLFIGGLNLYVYFKTAGMEKVFNDPELRPFDPIVLHLKIIFGGIVFGLLMIWFQLNIYPRLSKGLIKWKQSIIWMAGVLVFTATLMYSIHFLNLFFIDGLDYKLAIEISLEFIRSEESISFMIYGFFLSLSISFVRQLQVTFGEAILLNFILGNYSKSKAEERTFMFLDLNDSTSIAEKMGHVNYSEFLKTCFDDIMISLFPFKYEIYQFVGDEVVLTWKTDSDKTGMAIAMFDAIKTKFIDQENKYKAKFDNVPVFKAAVSCGPVSTRYIGPNGSHKVYHGDVLNTTARLLDHCKNLARSFLFTDFYLNSIESQMTFQPCFETRLKLRGKSKDCTIYSAQNVSPIYGTK